MAVILYECNICRRNVSKRVNPRGIESVGICTITDGCQGELVKKETKPDHAIGRPIIPKAGIQDWEPRNVLYDHLQHYVDSEWTVTHNLGSHPVVNVFIDYELSTGEKVLREVKDAAVIYDSADTLRVQFPTVRSGRVQCLVRNTVDGVVETMIAPPVAHVPTFVQLTAARMSPGELTIAIKVPTNHKVYGVSPLDRCAIRLQFISMVDGSVALEYRMPFRDITSTPVDQLRSPWSEVPYVQIGGDRFMVRSANIHPSGRSLRSVGVTEGCRVVASFVHPTNGVSVVPRHYLYVLLADGPSYAPADVNLEQLVDFIDIQNSTALAFRSDNLVINDSTLISKPHPNILPLHV